MSEVKTPEEILKEVKNEVAKEYKFSHFIELLLHLYKYGRHEHQETLGTNDDGMIPLLRGELEKIIDKVAIKYASQFPSPQGVGDEIKNVNDRLLHELEMSKKLMESHRAKNQVMHNLYMGEVNAYEIALKNIHRLMDINNSQK